MEVREVLTRADTNNLCTKGLKNVDFFNSDVIWHDDTTFVASVEFAQSISASLARYLTKIYPDTYFARPTVAMDIPVDPTVPSNILHPVCGTNRPASSASSITEEWEKFVSGDSDQVTAFRLTLQGNSILY